MTVKSLSYYNHGNMMYSCGEIIDTNGGRWTIKPKEGHRNRYFWERLYEYIVKNDLLGIYDQGRGKNIH